MFDGMKRVIGIIVDCCHADFRPLYAYQSLDIRDLHGNWREAQIIELPPRESITSLTTSASTGQTTSSQTALDVVGSSSVEPTPITSTMFDLESPTLFNMNLWPWVPPVLPEIDMHAVRIRYKGCQVKCDITLDLSPGSLASKRVAVLHTHTWPEPHVDGVSMLRPNTLRLKATLFVQILDPHNQSLLGAIKYILEIPQRTPPKRICLIRYKRSGSNYGEWIDEDSYRILRVCSPSVAELDAQGTQNWS